MHLKFKKSDKDILQGSPRTIKLIDGSGLFCKALPIYKLDIYLNYLINETNANQWIQACIELGPDVSRLQDVLLDKSQINYIPSDHGTYSVFADHDLVSAYFTIANEKVEVVPQDSCIEAFITIIEQNNLLEALNHYLTETKETFKTYTHSFIIWQIMELGLVDGLNLTNWDEVLTFEQRDFYFDLAQQRENKQIQNMFTAYSTIKRLQAGEKVDLFKDILFPHSNKKLDIKEQARQTYLANEYTGIKEKDDAKLRELLSKSKILDESFFF